MADLFGSQESEDMSSFLQILLNNPSSSAATTDSNPSAGAGGVPPPRISFSDYSSVFARESNEFCPSNRVIALDSTCEGSEASAVPLQRSSKRSRAAEVHNLSEKRRRSRINEKLKALQNLIPNSNKTDKASMLDEAIEYLKHLQLQVQMLTMRNGISLHPGYNLQSMVVPPAGVEVDKGCGGVMLDANRPSETLPPSEDIFMQSALAATNHSSSTQPMLVSSVASFVPPMQNHYGFLNHFAPSKDICRDDTMSRLQLDVGCSGNSSSPGMSS